MNRIESNGRGAETVGAAGLDCNVESKSGRHVLTLIMICSLLF
jgi:hypothetical protein